eukprot:TRINITY_DN6524_c0_g5_i1.p1 TRINITY_DN6524_c0_g5~~TRINITY_DN6524_c0_g5_i1.p1  ORF type:complete len:645 (+),score=63.40 TRINITY_DN6524_c0_g5_i1:148-2082(+)
MKALLTAAVFCTAALRITAAEEIKCKGDALKIEGFTDEVYNNRWWARHPTRRVNEKPTYWTGVSQLGTEWSDYGSHYIYWCAKGGGGWALGGPDILTREENLSNSSCHYLARKQTSGDIFEKHSRWVVKPTSSPDSKKPIDAVTTPCGVQINSCESDCKGLPMGVPLNKCVPRMRCGAAEPSKGYFKIITTKTDQQSWASATVLGYQDALCTRQLPPPEKEYVTKPCDTCSTDFTGGSYEIPCESLKALTPKAEDETIPIPGLLTIVVALLTVGVWLYLIVYWKGRRDARARQERTAAERVVSSEPLLPTNNNNNNNDSVGWDPRLPDPIHGLRTEVQRRIESFKSMKHGTASWVDSYDLASRAASISEDPLNFAFVELVREFPGDRELLCTAFDRPASPMSISISSDDGLASLVENALRASEDNRRTRLAQQWEEDNNLPPTLNGASLVSPNRHDEAPALNPLLALPATHTHEARILTPNNVAFKVSVRSVTGVRVGGDEFLLVSVPSYAGKGGDVQRMVSIGEDSGIVFSLQNPGEMLHIVVEIFSGATLLLGSTSLSVPVAQILNGRTSQDVSVIPSGSACIVLQSVEEEEVDVNIPSSGSKTKRAVRAGPPVVDELGEIDLDLAVALEKRRKEVDGDMDV